MFYPDNIPYLRLSKKMLSLPKGEPLGRGNIAFLVTNNREQSYDIMNNTTNVVRYNYFRYYFMNLYYRGKINGRTYSINYIPQKKTIRKEVESKTGLRVLPVSPLQSEDNHSLYFDLNEYLKIFFSITEKVIAKRKMELFWTYFRSIIEDPRLKTKYPKQIILIDVKNYPKIKGNLKETMTNPVFILYYTLFKNPELIRTLDIDFLLFAGNYNIKINPSKCDKNSYRLFMVELKKLYSRIAVNITNELEEEVINKQEQEEIVVDSIKQSFNFTGTEPVEGVITKLPEQDKEASKTEEIIDKKIASKVKVAEKKVSDQTKSPDLARVKDDVELSDEDLDDDPGVEEVPIDTHIEVDTIKRVAEDEISEDDEIIRELYQVNKVKNTPKSAASTARDEKLRKEMQNIKIKNMTIADLKKVKPSDVKVPVRDISNVLHTTNDNMKQVRWNNFNKTYIDKVMPKDIAEAVTSLSEKSLPLYVLDIDVEDTSNELNYVDTYTIKLEDGNRNRSTIKVDIPKFLDDKFLWIGGNKKLILNQNFLLPVVKTSPNTVQIVTNYNKMFIYRDDVKSLGGIERLTRLVNKDESLQKMFKVGDVSATNKGYITTIEYDELSKLFMRFSHGDCILFFDQSEALDYAKKNSIKIPDNKLFVGKDKNGPIFIDLDSQMTKNNESIVDIIIEHTGSTAKDAFLSEKGTKRLMYAKVKSMEKFVPVIALLGFWEGLTPVLKKMDAQYRLSDKYPKDLKTNESVIKFNDAYLVYTDTPFASLLINGLRQMGTEKYSITDFDGKEPYLDFIKKVYGKVSIANALDNYYEFTIDPITKEVLEDLDLPTEIVPLMIYAVKLLTDNQYTLEISEKLYRIRNAEVIPAILYDAMAKNYINYKNSGGRKKFSIPRDVVIKNLLDLKTVEDYSTLNPVQEVERSRTVTAKGWRGINLDDSYTIDKRAYDPSMIGVIGMTTSPDGSCGVARILTTEPNIKGVRGYVNYTDKKDLKNLKDVRVFSPSELLIPLGATRDDPNRVGF